VAWHVASFLNISYNFKYFIKNLFCSENKYEGAAMGRREGVAMGVEGAAIGRRGRGRPQGPRTNKHGRPMKETLSSKYGASIEQYLHNGVMSEVSYKRSIQSIHTEAVSSARSRQGQNPLIKRRPPAVSESEDSLPRPFQTTLSQLRSTYCSRLKSYQLKI
jgi:hypothetical protein